MIKILVTGANGQLGSELREIAPNFQELEFKFTDIDELDITNRGEVADCISEFNPKYLVNCAAYTNVDRAETEYELASLLNATAAGILAEQAALAHCRMIHVSTDYVFDGRGPRPYGEDHEVNPQSVYGRTKLDGEILCIQNNFECMIIRTSWLYSAFGNNFVKTIIRLGNERPEIGVIADQVGTPTNAADLAEALLTIILNIEDNSKPFPAGNYHFSNEGVASWYDFTKAIFELCGINCKVKPIATEDYPSPVARPAYSVMNKSKIKLNFGLQIPYWRDSLADYFKKLDARKS